MQQVLNQDHEHKMKVTYELIQRNSDTLSISTDEEFEAAADFAQGVKSSINEVTDYFAPMKDAAYKAHSAICAREKEMLAPLKHAETQCKKAMGDYVRIKQERARQLELEMKRRAQEEADRLLAEAVKAEQSGNLAEAEMAMEQATVADQLKDVAVVVDTAPKISGVSASKDFEIISIDPSRVPVSVAGVVIRPVDEKAVLRLIKASKGGIVIPGVTYRETVRMSVSARRQTRK